MNNSKKIIVLYMPVVHQEYISFLSPYWETHVIMLIGDEAAHLLPKFFRYYQRDVRRLSATYVFNLLSKQGYQALIAGTDNFPMIPQEYDEIIMPDEDVSREIMEVYPEMKKAKLILTALRFDRLLLNRSFQADVDAIVSEDEMAKVIMERATEEAIKTPDWWREVGCIITTRDGRVIRSYNDHMPTIHTVNEMGDPRANFNQGESIDVSLAIHAEEGAIAEAARLGIPLDGATMYVTTYPCPGCARQIVRAGIKKFFFRDGYSLAHGKDVLKTGNVEVFQVKAD